jgi:hypothetical protein
MRTPFVLKHKFDSENIMARLSVARLRAMMNDELRLLKKHPQRGKDKRLPWLESLPLRRREPERAEAGDAEENIGRPCR